MQPFLYAIIIATAIVLILITIAICCCCFCRKTKNDAGDVEKGIHLGTHIKNNNVSFGRSNKEGCVERVQTHSTVTNVKETKGPCKEEGSSPTPRYTGKQTTQRQQQHSRSRSADSYNRLNNNNVYPAQFKKELPKQQIKDGRPILHSSLSGDWENRCNSNQYAVFCEYYGKAFKQINDVNNHKRDTGKGNCCKMAYTNTKIGFPFKETVSVQTQKARLQTDKFDKAKEIAFSVLNCIHKSPENKNRFSEFADREGSTLVGLKIGNPTEFDFSVSLNLSKPPKLKWQTSLNWEYTTDIDGVMEHQGKRNLNEDAVQTFDVDNPRPIPNGFVIVKLHTVDAHKFKDSCLRGICPARELLKSFHDFIYSVAHDKYINDAHIEVHKSTNGPAVTFKIKSPDISNVISIDLTPKILISFDMVRSIVVQGTGVKQWLKDRDQNGTIYLVPKGDKYWKISFANFENNKLQQYKNDSVEKQCIRLMKYRLSNWRPTANGLKGISSYTVKNILFWLREMIPNDNDWIEEHLADRYVNFLQEFLYACETRCLKEYFNETVDLLDGKDEAVLVSLIDVLKKEIYNAYYSL